MGVTYFEPSVTSKTDEVKDTWRTLLSTKIIIIIIVFSDTECMFCVLCLSIVACKMKIFGCVSKDTL